MGTNGRKQSMPYRAIRTAGAFGVLAIIGGSTGMGCLDRDINTLSPRTTSTIVEKLTQSSVDKIDLLLAIDNSRSMADKQEILALAVPDLVEGLVNPNCVSKETGDPLPPEMQPGGPLEECPDGSEREFEPVTDIHIGIISSSLGDIGGSACSTEPGPLTGPENDDKGQLLVRDDAGGTVTTYNCDETGQGCNFLAWDPEQKLTPPGEANLGAADMGGIVGSVTDLVRGVGENGCGYEAQLESWVRFLVDPNPYNDVEIVDDRINRVGTDETILKQRADFMRPDSLLAIIMLTDENDCSANSLQGSQGWIPFKTDSNFRMPRGSSKCAEDPNDPCCYTCRAGSAPAGCTPKEQDPECMKGDLLDAAEDNINLRCWEQKRRYGIDFLYPPQRYVNALTQTSINPNSVTLDPNEEGGTVPNPLFTDLNPNDANSVVRDTGLVFLGGIVGVPWQDIARKNAAGQPDLVGGLNTEGEAVGGFQTFDELNDSDPAKNVWAQILGQPNASPPVPPTDPLMLESIDPRSGTNPATGESLTTFPTQNSINGHEYTIPDNGDLQYACIFPLIDNRDCSMAGANDGCDCRNTNPNLPGGNDNPLCEENPADMNNRTLQTKAKAFPGTRELEVLFGVQGQGIVGSVCPAEINDQNSPIFGYRPAIGAIIDRLKQELGGQCLPRTLTVDDEGNVPCLVIEARNSGGNPVCDPATGRRDVGEDNQAAVDAAKQDPLAETAGWDAFCEIVQLQGDERELCQNELDPSGINGWCYIDATTPKPIGNEELVASCPPNERRLINFVGNGEVLPGATLFITCSGDTGEVDE